MCNGVAVRTNQNLICDHLLPKRDLLLQTQLVNDVQRLDSLPLSMSPFNIMLFILLIHISELHLQMQWLEIRN